MKALAIAPWPRRYAFIPFAFFAFCVDSPPDLWVSVSVRSSWPPLKIYLYVAFGLALQAGVAHGRKPALRLAIIFKPAIFHRLMKALAHVVQDDPAILHRAPRQTGHYRHNDWRAGEDSRRHSPYCRNRAVRFLREWSPLCLHGRFRQIPAPRGNRAGKGQPMDILSVGKKKGQATTANPSAIHPGSKEKPEQFCTLHGELCNRLLQSHSDSPEYVRFLQ